MNTQEIIGRTITDIFVWSKMEFGGFDEAEVFIQLDNGRIIGIPWDFESENIERQHKKDSESLFSDLSDIPIYHINSEEKTIQEILDAKKKRESSFFGRIKKTSQRRGFMMWAMRDHVYLILSSKNICIVKHL